MGEAVWQIQLGADPNARARVRPGMLIESGVILTPLEAAVWVHDPYMLQLLIEHGAIIDRQTLARLWCVNVARGGDKRIEALLPPLDSGLPSGCDTASLIQ